MFGGILAGALELAPRRPKQKIAPAGEFQTPPNWRDPIKAVAALSTKPAP
jgi:hypothetical protein